MPLHIIPREEWNARSYMEISYLTLPVGNVFSMITNTDECFTVAQGRNAMLTLQKIHMYKKMRDIRYNFLVTSDGTVFEGRGWIIQPAILKRYKELQASSLMVAFFWKGTAGDPPDIMYESLDRIIRMGIENEFIAKKFLLHHVGPCLKAVYPMYMMSTLISRATYSATREYTNSKVCPLKMSAAM